MRILIIIIYILLGQTAFCSGLDTSISEYPIFEEYTSEFVKGNIGFSVNDILKSIANTVFSEIITSKLLLCEILVISVISGVIKFMEDKRSVQAAYITSYTLMAVTVIQLISQVITYGKEIVHSIGDFITKFAPILLGLIAASGSTASAGVYSPILATSVYILTIAVDKIIMPMIFASSIIGIIGNFYEKLSLSNLNKLIRNTSKWLLTALLTIFVSLCSIYGFNSPVLDALGAKAVKFTIGSIVPVVGGLLAESMDTVLSGTRLLKNAAGSAGMICIIIISAVPMIKTWVILFLLKFCSAIAEPVCDKKISNMLQDAAESVSSVFTLIVTSVMLFLICIGIIIGTTGIR